MNGTKGAAFTNGNPGSSISGIGASAIINANINGRGSISLSDGGSLEVGRTVGSNQTISISSNPIPQAGNILSTLSTLTIDHPSQFLGTVQFSTGDIDLIGLAKADSFTYKRDMMTIYSGKTIIDKLSLEHVGATPIFAEQNANGVRIFAGLTEPTGYPSGPYHVLPGHGT